MRWLKCFVGILVLFVLGSGASWAQTGKVAGTVVDTETGEPLPGVNIVLQGEQQGSTTDVEGYYVILNVQPGTYALEVSFVGYTRKVVLDVEVNTDLTTEIDVELQPETVGLDEVTVQAQDPVVKRDISANLSNFSAESIENLPLSSVEEVVGMQAGIESGFSVRGGGSDEVNFIVDGMSTRNARNNTPFSGLSYTSIKKIQVQTGGFNAEYGNVRSGLVNVTTREGPRDRYTADALLHYSPPHKEYFGSAPNDPTAYYMRPYVDPDVAFIGTNSSESPWDRYTKLQYPTFEGWNSVSEGLLADGDPSNDLTPQEAQQVYLWHHRKSMEITDPEYTFDGSFGGPVPFVSEPLGDLRFFASFRQVQDPYLVPQRRRSYQERTGQLKVTSDVAKGMKLMLQGLYAESMGFNTSWNGTPGMMTGEPERMAGSIHSLNSAGLFAKDVWSLSDVTRLNIGAKFTHTLGSRTFYEVRLQRNFTDYFTRPGPTRSDEVVDKVGGMKLDEAPFGYDVNPSFGLAGGMWFGGRYAVARDTSNVAVWTGKFDITSQINQTNQVKAGVTYHFTDYRSNHGTVMPSFASAARPKYVWHRQPIQGAAYLQDKLEFEGMVANVGVRLDYMDAGKWWYAHETYDRAFASAKVEDLETKPIKPQFSISPRLGISFPTSAKSKLYFNYGHFRTIQAAPTLFEVAEKETGGISQFGNPNHPMPKTVAYELGYEYNLFQNYLLRVAGYYKALDNQSRSIRYTSLTGLVQYNMLRPFNYEDIRGFEVTFRKNAGKWVRGFGNFSFMVRKEGNFGYARNFENRLVQRRYERETVEDRYRPVPEPYSRFNVEFLSPSTFGPQWAGVHPLGDWRLSWLGQWRGGNVFTWSGGSSQSGLRNNVQWTDYYNLDLRLTKSFNTSRFGQAQFFVDVSNLLNLQRLNRAGAFFGKRDWERYMMSLHLPKDAFEELDGDPYKFIPGDDQPGDYRKPGVAFVPIEIVPTVEEVQEPHQRPLYYEDSNSRYMVYSKGSWQPADKERVEQLLKDKAYIDMPNIQAFRFLNPRNVTFGLRVSF